MTPLAAALPDNAGYVAAAYLVFLLLLLIYLGIMSTKLGKVEKETNELLALAQREQAQDEAADAAVADARAAAAAAPDRLTSGGASS